MQPAIRYDQLRPEDRMTIASMRQRNCGVRAIARLLGRAPSTISRKLGRNTATTPRTVRTTPPQACGARRRQGRPAAKLSADSLSWSLVMTLLNWKWSPQQIAATLRRTFPSEPARHVSHETIYTAIYALARGELRRQLIVCLRQGRGTRLPRSRGTDRRGQIPAMVSIRVRPPELKDRVMPGHWEGDFIKGAETSPLWACWWSVPAV
jgi:IS30 family transposase